MARNPLKIVIVGGSLGGLMHGIVAARQGHHVMILERSANALQAQLGAGLGVADALATFMHEYDHSQQPYSLCPPEALYFDSRGRLITTTRPGITATSWSILYSRLRATFGRLGDHLIPQSSCGTAEDPFGQVLAKYVDGAEVVAVEAADGVVQVEYLDNIHETPITVSADLVIVADGAGSKIRARFAAHDTCRYVGYAAWRGTILEKDMMEKTKLHCLGNDRHCKIERSFFLSYTIPGQDGSLDSDKRLRNWVWYRRYGQDSAELKDILVDREGIRHQYALPPDTVRDEVWRRQQRLAVELLDSDSADLVVKTKRPFFQAITEVPPARAVLLGGRMLLVGDALAVLRPLSGQGTSQAAYSALLLREVLEGTMEIEEWEEKVLLHSREANEVGLSRERILELGEAH